MIKYNNTAIVSHFYTVYRILGLKISGSCEGSYGSNDYIISPNFPKLYDNNLDCRWRISAPVKDIITLSFSDDFDIEEGYDFLRIYDGIDIHGRLIQTYSGNNPTRFIPTGNNLYLQFKTDISAGYDQGLKSGFKIEVGTMGKHI